MKTLRNKTFLTIFSIISLFILIFVIVFNYQLYAEEYHAIENNLSRMHNFTLMDEKQSPPLDKKRPKDNLKNHFIMDYAVYTILLDENNNIIDKISHNENSFNNKVLAKALSILKKETTNTKKIGCLYVTSYAYSLNIGKTLVIIDTANIKTRLLNLLLKSLIIFGVGEILIFLITKKITDWLIKPVEESFTKQKDFIANASHELKTPLSVIIASIDCITMDKKNEKWLNNIKNESEKMTNLITRLLDLSKSENIKKENFQPHNISKIIEKRALVFESLAYEKNVTISTNIKSNVIFNCSATDIDELLSIIIDNAISHSDKNSNIKINLYQDKANITIEVINKGEAISKEEKDKIFERFYRLDKSHNRESNRYGLGLSIAKNIVDTHNGTIKAFSDKGYTTFVINFKIKGH